MQSKLPKENTVANFVNQCLRSVTDAGVLALKTALTTEAPWLKLPIISQVANYVFTYLGNYFYEFFSLHATFIVIDFQTAADKDAYIAAIEAYQKSKLTGDQNAINAEREKLKKALGDLIEFDGTVRR
jgi:hypothetical protein